MYIELVLGVVAYILYFIYDYNSIHENNKIIKSFFALGSLLLVGATVYAVVRSWSNYNIYIILPMAILGTFFLGLEIYTLFFALPFDKTYVKDSSTRLAYTKGVYGICRHPGVLWFIGLYLCLWGLTWNLIEGTFFMAMVLGNIGYIIYQDYYIFPKTFSNYGEYKKTTPFLLPLVGRRKNGR